MSEPPFRGALDDYRATFGTGFSARRLWQDRRAVLAEPRLCTQPRPPLHHAPLRFALMLVVVPMLAMAWVSAQLAGAMYPDGRPAPPVQAAALAAEAPLADWLGHPDAQALSVLTAPKLSQLPPPTRAYFDRARTALAINPGSGHADAAATRAAVDAFLVELQAAPMQEATRRHLAAELLRDTRARRRIDGAIASWLRTVTEGGAGMQVLAALSLVLSAWLLQRSLRGDARFPRAAAGGALYLYYGTARVFWFSMASILAYGVLAFASASGNDLLFARSNLVSQLIGGAATIYLLLFAREFARALRDDDEPLPRGAVAVMAWRLLWTQVVSMLLLFAAVFVAGTLAGIAAAFWFMRG